MPLEKVRPIFDTFHYNCDAAPYEGAGAKVKVARLHAAPAHSVRSGEAESSGCLDKFKSARVIDVIVDVMRRCGHNADHRASRAKFLKGSSMRATISLST